MLKTTDNNCGEFKVEEPHLANFKKIANIQISKLKFEKNQNLLIFPDTFKQYGDNLGKEKIFSLDDFSLTTGNIMGFVGVNDSELKIQSRFTKNDGEDYFLHYMLQKVFSINLFDLKHSYNKENVFDFLLYLFPFYLKKALRQGLFKEYQHKEYNNANVRGSIDVSQHLRKNIPFAGKIAYRTREHSYDNRITQIIRHTIEYIYQHKFGRSILSNDSEIQACVSQIRLATPNYDKNKRHSVLNKNIKQVSHPFFYEYCDLQKICNQILHYEGLKYGKDKDKDKVYGLLFDGAWLWEEYLNTLLINHNFIHPENKTGKNPIYLFKKSRYPRYPDFYQENIVLDAKYKRLTSKDSLDRNDMHQIISYMYVKQARIGGFICPSDNCLEDNLCASLGELEGYGGNVKLWTIPIPQTSNDFNDFCLQMKLIEKRFKDNIENILNTIKNNCLLKEENYANI